MEVVHTYHFSDVFVLFIPTSSTPPHRFVDGEGYMEAVANAIDGAKEEILITDWQ